MIEKTLLYFLVFASAGITLEVLWSSFHSLSGKKNKRLTGKISAWMLLIYGSIYFIVLFVQSFAGEWHIALRWIIYSLFITTGEFTSGYLIKKITGIAPWDYSRNDPYDGIGSKKRFNFMGLICLEYAILWGGFGLLAEQLIFFLQSHLIL
ncbi:MAG: hypothetical protein V1859_06855 [archaeon]